MDPFAVMLFVGGGLYCFAAFFCFAALVVSHAWCELDADALRGGGGALLGAGASLVSIGTLLAFILVCAGVWVLRRTRPDIERPFRAPAITFVAPAGIVTCFLLMYGLPVETWERLAIWMAIGFLVYFLYGRNHSRIGRNK